MTKSSLTAIGFSLALAGLGTSAFAADIIEVSGKIVVPVAPSRAWLAIKDFDGLHTWHPAIASSVVNGAKPNVKGAVRTLMTKDGVKVTEELFDYSDKRMAYSYGMKETPMPVTDFASSIQVSKAAKGSVIVWTSHFKAKEGSDAEEAKKMVEGFHKAGLDSLMAKLK